MIKRCLLLSLLSVSLTTSNCRADGTGYDDARPTRYSDTDRAMASRMTLGQAGFGETNEAVAHFSRARSLLIAALKEFDRGAKIASPSELLDTAQWRNTLIDRAEDLDRVLDPQPRATQGGIKFEADSRLLPEANK